MSEDTDLDGVGFFNCIGILITLIVGFAFIFVLARTLMFIRKIIFKLRIIMKNSYINEKACLGLPISTNNRAEEYTQRRDVFRKEIIRSWNLRFTNVFKYVLDRYNHLVYIIFCRTRTKIDKLNLLKPQFSFYLMIWFLPFFVMWTLAIFIVGTDLTIQAGTALGLSIVAGFFGSLISVVLTFWLHYFWNKNIWAAFERGSEEKIQAIEELDPNIAVEMPAINNEEDDNQSITTNVTRIFNYRLTSRNAFLGEEAKAQRNRMRRIQNTLLVPESQANTEEQFRATFMTNFTRRTLVTNTRTEDEENKLQRSPQNMDTRLQSSPEHEEEKSEAQTMAQDEPLACYKLIRDRETLGDVRLIQQESESIRNIQNIFFFLLLIITLCVWVGIASYTSFVMSNEAALMGFIIFVFGIILDMLIFRLFFCFLMTLFLKCIATNRKLQGSIQLSGKTSQMVHRMLQDMMLGTVEKNRVKEHKEKIAKVKPLKTKPKLAEIFLKRKLAEIRKNKGEKEGKEDSEDKEEDQEINIHNLQKFDIFEEKEYARLSSEGASTGRKIAYSVHEDEQVEKSGGEEEKKSTSGIVEDSKKDFSNGGINEDEKQDNLEQINNLSKDGSGEGSKEGSKDVSAEQNLLNDVSNEKSLTMKRLVGYYKDKVDPEPETYNDYWFEEDEFFPSVLNECIELNLLLLEKIYNTFKRKAATVVKNFRKDNFHHLKPKLIEATKPPPDELLRNKKRNDQVNELDDILEENSIHDETALIDKNSQIEDTYDEDKDIASGSEIRGSDHDFENELNERIDRNGLRTASREGMNRDEEDARRKALLANLHSQESSKNESRVSSAIPEDDQIAFQDANLANLNSKDGSDMDIVDDLEEQEMVYYPKEDQTQYSKPLGLNKAPKKKDPEPFSFGENSLKPSYDHSKLLEDQTQNEVLSDFLDDLEGIDEGDESINLIPGGTQDPNDPHDPHGTLGPRGPHGTTGLLGDADDIHGRNGGAHGRTGDINGGIGGFGGILGDPGKGKKKKRQKKKKLTEEQKRRLRKVGDIYGQNAEDLGLSPRGGKKKGRITKKKSKSPNRGKKGGTKQEERATRFRGLNLNRPERSEAGEYDKLKRKLQKFRKRKDLSFWVDYDSPYAEFLPHRFREWVPETKTGLNLDENPKNMHANYKAMELSKIYSKGHGMVEETKEDEEFDPITGNYLSPNRAPSRNLRPKSNASMNVESVDELSSKKKSRGMTSSKRNKSLNKLPVVENSEEIIDF